MPSRRAIAALGAALMLAWPGHAATRRQTPPAGLQSSWNVEAVGTMLCDGRPLVGARVELMHSRVSGTDVFDTVMATGVVDGAGGYALRGAGGTIFGPPAPYVRVVYEGAVSGSGLRVVHESGARSDHGDTRAHPYHTGVIDMGVQDFGGQDCRLWLGGQRVLDDYKAEVDPHPALPYGGLDVLRWSAVYFGTPWTSLDTIHWPTSYPTGIATTFHEFGHTLRHSFDGDFGHFLGDAINFNYARFHNENDVTNEGFAFNEGWAEFWETRRSTPPARRGFYNSPPNWSVEGDVAAELRRLADCGVSYAGMAGVLHDHAGAIHSLPEYVAFFKARFPRACVPPDPPPPSPPDACAAGRVTQQFYDGMVACAGKVAKKDAATLCGAGHVLCTAAQWVSGRRHLAPEHDYWVKDKLLLSNEAGFCLGRPTSGTDCGDASLHVCTATGNDTEGNTCGTRNCALDPAPGTEFPPNVFLGGCGAGDTTAGALCCLAPPLAVAPPPDDELRRQRERDRAELVATIAALEQRVKEARRDAVLPTTCPASGCGPALEVLTRPAFLQAALELHQLFLARFDAAPASSFDVLRATDAGSPQRQRDEARAYALQTLGLQRRAFQAAIAALQPALTARLLASEAQLAIAELETRLREVEARTAQPDGAPVPQPFDAQKWRPRR